MATISSVTLAIVNDVANVDVTVSYSLTGRYLLNPGRKMPARAEFAG